MNPEEQINKPSRVKFKFYYLFLIFVLILVVVSGVYYFLTPSVTDQYQQGVQIIKNYEDLMRADTIGGQTPEATLKLFVDALKKQDVDLASKYFILDENGSREKWVKKLTELKEKNLLLTMAEDIEKKAKRGKSDSDNYATFELLNNHNIVGVTITMELNKFSKVWKIESL